MRNVPQASQAQRSDARKPVMAMNDIVTPRLSTAKFFNVASEDGKVLIEIIFMYWGNRSSFYVNHADIWSELYDLGGCIIGPAGKDIDFDVIFSQSAS